jgi:hypothetical protein
VNSFFTMQGRWEHDVRSVNGSLDVSGQASAGGEPFDLHLYNYLSRIPHLD